LTFHSFLLNFYFLLLLGKMIINNFRYAFRFCYFSDLSFASCMTIYFLQWTLLSDPYTWNEAVGKIQSQKLCKYFKLSLPCCFHCYISKPFSIYIMEQGLIALLMGISIVSCEIPLWALSLIKPFFRLVPYQDICPCQYIFLPICLYGSQRPPP
jgi:hypothetical protein